MSAWCCLLDLEMLPIRPCKDNFWLVLPWPVTFFALFMLPPLNPHHSFTGPRTATMYRC